jgi:FXSXX-COOH protein
VPTFAWYEYVRLVRRVRLADLGRDAAALRTAIDQLRRERAAGGGAFFTIVAGQAVERKKPDDYHCAIDSFGAHGQRELLEGIGELARTCPDGIDDVLYELASYLRWSPPQPPRLRTEHCAGIGENAPNALPAVSWPTQWRYDEWHFPCALAVFERHQEAEVRELALRHLLYASDTTTRLRAIEAVRQWPRERRIFADDLAHCLDAEARDVVREALVTIQRSPDVVGALRTRLQRIADGSDRELAALAKRALR